MAIFAYSEVALAHFSDLLHDLHFPMPKGRLAPEKGEIRMTFTDQDRILRGDAVSRFSLLICEIYEADIQGQPERCPLTLIFNEFRYKDKESVLVLEAVHPLLLKFRVKRIHLALDQIA